MKRYDLIVVGAGPAGLSAAAEAAGRGLNVLVLDENARPGGQLFKQIHKFFGSREQGAKIRGYKIGEELLSRATESGATVLLNSTVTGIYENKEVAVNTGGRLMNYKADSIIIACGAAENAVAFDGWTLPGVMGAGAAQTMMNLYGVLPGKKVFILGSGNVGLVIGFQLLQAGCEVVAVADAAPKIGGYGVHAAKLARCGVPFYLSHTIEKAEGTQRVSSVRIVGLDEKYRKIPGTSKRFEADTVCLAVGLSPMSQLLRMAGCGVRETPGGAVPETGADGATSIPGIFAAGDVSGIGEASSAMIQGRITGLAASYYLGYAQEAEYTAGMEKYKNSLQSLREGMFSPENKGKTLIETDEGIKLSENLLRKGFIADDEIRRFPGYSKQTGIHPVVECTQNIPCNPCGDVCPKKCIKIAGGMTSLPKVDGGAGCTGCGLCVASCPGQAIFLIDETSEAGFAKITLPYEFLPLPSVGEKGSALDRSGLPVCEAEVTSVMTKRAFDHTNLLTIKVPVDMADKTRFYRKGDISV